MEQWAKRLDGSTYDNGLTRNFRLYLAAEHKIGVTRLFARFGVDLAPSQADRDEAAVETLKTA